MAIADKLMLLADTKEALRAKLKLAKSVPFSKYPDYVNWQNVPSIPNKAFYADFKNDRYVKDGVPCTFKDLFTFNRAGKAWLVKDTGLVEYAVDVPRFDNGLLIEQSATNLFAYSVDIRNADVYKGVTTTGNVNILDNNTASFENLSALALGNRNKYPELVGATVVFSVYTATTNIGSNEYGGLSAIVTHFNGNVVTGTDVISSSITGGRFVATRKCGGYVYTLLYPTSSLNSETKYVGANGALLEGVRYFQIEASQVASSYIKTTTAPVTRPADFLLNKITGTTVTGDWDSTLTLSIVNGQLVHSGYGRIRSLEIN